MLIGLDYKPEKEEAKMQGRASALCVERKEVNFTHAAGWNSSGRRNKYLYTVYSSLAFGGSGPKPA